MNPPTAHMLPCPAAPIVTTVGRCRTVAIGDLLLHLDIVADGVVKVRRSRGAAEQPSPAVLPAAPTLGEPDTLPRWTEEAGRLRVTTGGLHVEVDLATGLVAFRDGDGVLLAEEGVEVSTGEGPQHLAFVAGPSEQFYGLGQKVRGPDDTSLRWNGRQRIFGPFGNAREKSCPGVPGQGNGNTTIPLLHSSAGYGLFLDNHYRHGWDFTDPARWTVEASQGEHRYYLIHGPDSRTILERYTRLTGRPPMPPKWALGLLQSKFGYRNWDEVEATAERYRSAGIPADAIILDLYWFGGVPHFGGADRIGSLAWDEASFPDPAGHIARLRALGFRVVLIEEPYVDRALPAWEEAAAAGHFAALPETGAPAMLEKWWGRGGLVDMTSAAARRWWWRRHLPLVADGVAGWWTDLGEPDTFDDRSRYAGGTHADVHNLYAMEWARALAEGYERDFPGERAFTLTRAGYAGMQRYGAAVWSNDVMTSFEWLAPQVATGLNIGLSGIPYWGTDVGGFIGPVASDALYTRWFQFGAFCPIFRPHGQDRPTAPFEFSPETEAICGRYARLRYRLLPYIYTAAREAHDTGVPLMRPMTMDHPHDPFAGDLGAEYLFGPSILVAPVTHEGVSRNVYLPDGEWVDFWTNRSYTGATWLRHYPAPLDTLPLFVRAGAILPLGPEVAHTGERALDELTLRVYPGAGPSRYDLYEDDGVSTAYAQGAYARTAITMETIDDELVLELGALDGSYAGMPLERTVTVEAILSAAPATVRWNGTLLAEVAVDVAAPAWSYDRATRVLRIRAPRTAVRRAQRFSIGLGEGAK